MDDIVNFGVLGEDLFQCLLVCDVDLVQLGPLSAQQFYSVDDFLGRVVEVVDDDDFISSVEKGEGGEGADVAGATG